MKLIVMRHFKSSWDQPVDDHDRVLNGRGQQAARAMGDWLRTQNHVPDQALVSTAARTRESYERLGFAATADHFDDLYLAEPDAILQRLKASAVGHAVLLLAHNPGIADFAAALVARPPNHPRFHDYPTGATLVVETDLTWGAAPVIDFAVPRDFA